MRPEDVINLDTYPIADRGDSRRAAIIQDCRERLERDQYCVLPGFIRPGALDQAVTEAEALRRMAHHNNARRNCYLQRQPDPSLPPEHSRNIFFDASTRMIAYDLIPPTSPVRTLYHWTPTRQMIEEIVGVEELFDNADPYQPANILCYEDGDRSSWHFDSVNAFTVTLMLQAPDSGGAFEIVPNTRSESDPNEDYVRDVLQGNRPQDAVEVAREPGALCIFRGCNSVHRVAPVEGDTMRIMGVFVYETEPGIIGDPEVNETVYGPRVAVA